MRPLDSLHTALNQWVSLTDDEWSLVSAIFRPHSVPAHTNVARPGDTDHHIIFTVSGLLRFYYIDMDGKEINKAFIRENQFAGSVAAATLNLPLYYGIEALEPTKFLRAEFGRFQELYTQSHKFEVIGRKFAERLLARKELRTRSLLMKTATERYRDFLGEDGDLAKRIPQYHIASYLGITDVSLSRLKRTM